MTSPHSLPPLTVFPREDEPTRERLGVLQLLAEPEVRSGQWMPSIVRRLVAASTGPIACGLGPGPFRDRLETAGWFCALAHADLEDARDASWPALCKVRRLSLGYGSLTPRLVLMGERTTRASQLPFASRSGVWLLRALRELGHDELQLYLGNVLCARGRRRQSRLAAMRDAFASYEPTWVALGNEARDRLASAGIEHVHVLHPGAHRRWKYEEDVLGYARLLRKAGVPDGPYLNGNKLPISRVEELPALPSPYDLTTVAYIKQATPRNRRPHRSQVGVVKVEAARRLFIEKGITLAAAAKEVGVKHDRLRTTVNLDDWRAERDEYHRQLTEKAKEDRIRKEAKAMGNSRSLAWASVERALGKLAARLRDGDQVVLKDGRVITKEYLPTPRDCEAIARTAIMLSGVDAAEHVEEVKKTLRALSTADLLRKMQNQLGMVTPN